MRACALAVATSRCTSHVHVCWHFPFSWQVALDQGLCPHEHELIRHCEDEAEEAFVHLAYVLLPRYPTLTREILYQQKLIVVYLSCATWLREAAAGRCKLSPTRETRGSHSP